VNLKIIDGIYSVCRLLSSSSVPYWVHQSFFYSVSKSDDELSIVCEQKFVPENIKVEKNWGLIKVEGPLDFSLTGILSSLAEPLAKNNISIFAISTFDTDYLLVKLESLPSAKAVLGHSGFTFA